MILWELCKSKKFDNATKWYIHKPKSTQENGTHTILWEFETQTCHLISVRRLTLVIIIKKQKRDLTRFVFLKTFKSSHDQILLLIYIYTYIFVCAYIYIYIYTTSHKYLAILKNFNFSS